MEVELREKFVKDISAYLKENKIKFELESSGLLGEIDIFTFTVNKVSGVIQIDEDQIYVFNNIEGCYGSFYPFEEYYYPEDFNVNDDVKVSDFLELDTFIWNLKQQGTAYKKLKSLMSKIEDVYAEYGEDLNSDVPNLINYSYFTDYLEQF